MIAAAQSDILLITYFENAYSPNQLRHRADSTRSGYRSSIKSLSEFLKRDALLADLDEPAIEAWEKSLSLSGLSKHRVYQTVMRIRKIMRFVSSNKLCQSAQAPGISDLPEKAYGFHYRPWGKSRLPCPTCGLTGHKGLHRAVRPNDAIEGAFVIRRPMREGGDYIVKWHHAGRPYSPLGRKVNRAPTGPTKRIVGLLSKAAALCAMGKTVNEAAVSLGSTGDRIHGWQTDHPEMWKAAFDRAMEKVKASVQAQISSMSFLDDPAPYLAMADRCEDWSRARGETLLPKSAELTLPGFYEAHYLPMCLFDAKPSTIYYHRVVLRRWAFLTGNPPLVQITNETVAQFRNCLSKMRGQKSTERMSPNTVRSCLRNIETFLGKAGPACRGNRDALGFIKEVPWARPPKAIVEEPRYVEESLINAVYAAADTMKLPRFEGTKPGAWWRAVLVFVYNTGLRRGALFRLRMDDIDWVNGSVRVRAVGAKTSIGQSLPLNATVLEHLRAMSTERKFVFERQFSLDRFQILFHRLQNAAGIPRDQHFGLHDLRKTASTVLWEDNPAAAQLMLGHTSSRTTQGHYVNSRGILSRAAEKMYQPAAFASATEGGGANA